MVYRKTTTTLSLLNLSVWKIKFKLLPITLKITKHLYLSYKIYSLEVLLR